MTAINKSNFRGSEKIIHFTLKFQTFSPSAKKFEKRRVGYLVHLGNAHLRTHLFMATSVLGARVAQTQLSFRPQGAHNLVGQTPI